MQAGFSARWSLKVIEIYMWSAGNFKLLCVCESDLLWTIIFLCSHFGPNYCKNALKLDIELYSSSVIAVQVFCQFGWEIYILALCSSALRVRKTSRICPC